MKKRTSMKTVIGILLIFSAFILYCQVVHSESSKDKEEADKIKNVWTSFVKKLSIKDVEGALEYIIEERKEGYRKAFAVIKDKFPEELSKKEEILINEINDQIATGENTVEEKGGVYSYPIIFVKEKGQWKIQSF